MVIESTFGARLRQVMAERGYKYEEFGTLLGMNAQTINRYVLGQREPKIGTATAIALALDVDPLWLQGYDVPRLRPPDFVGGIPTGRECAVPILGCIRAGMPALAVENIEGYAATDVPDPEEHFYLRVSGDSMVNAGIRDGDLVLIRRQDAADNGQIVACLVDGEDATLKRFRCQRGVVILQPENPAYEPRIIPVRDFDAGTARIVGVAVKLVRNL